jgi:hypothetical protein
MEGQIEDTRRGENLTLVGTATETHASLSLGLSHKRKKHVEEKGRNPCACIGDPFAPLL